MPRLLILALAGAMLAGLAGCDRNSGGGSPGYSAPPAPPAVLLR